MGRRRSAFVCLSAALLLSACGSYYMIKDPQSGKEFYTTSISQRKGQAVVFTDAVSGAKVTLQNSKVSEIPKDQYKAAVAKK